MDKYLLLNAMKTRTSGWARAKTRSRNKSYRKREKEYCTALLSAYDEEAGAYDYDSINDLSRPRRGYRERGHENFGCIESYLRSKIGFPWNDIYSEICAVGDKRSKKLRRAVNLIKMYIFGWPGNDNSIALRNGGFVVDTEGFLQYLEAHQVRDQKKHVHYPSKEQIHEFVTVDPMFWWQKEPVLARKVIRNELKLYWAYSTGMGYRQGNELKKAEYKFFNRLKDEDQKYITAEKTEDDRIYNKFTSFRRSSNGNKYSIFYWSKYADQVATAHERRVNPYTGKVKLKYLLTKHFLGGNNF